jgi:tRNA threonylcarbamoyladenosine biosynthesis protein TsaE
MNNRISFLSQSLEDYPKISKKIAELSLENKVVAFKGDLGAGKTTLIKNICNFLNVIDEVHSPTFSLVNEYKTKKGDIIYHFDFYRINEIEEAYDIGFEEYLDSGNLCLIEWPEKVEELLNDGYLEIAFEIKDELRDITINLTKDV